MPPPRPWLLTLCLLFGISLPFVGKPVHIDDAATQMLAHAAAVNPWRPHGILVNWQGTTERAFDVLSSPPGIAWYLAPVIDEPVWLQHLWMLLWLLPAAWGAWVLGQRFTARPVAATLLIMLAPGALLASHALTPDLPVLACSLAGLAGLTRSEGPPLARRWPWALLLGLTVVFRYSGIILVGIVALWPLLAPGVGSNRNRLRAAVLLGLAAAVPIELLALHDALAYGEVHALAMHEFQDVSRTPRELFRKATATIAMVGGGLVLPVLCWARWRRAVAGVLLGYAVGAVASVLSGHMGHPGLSTVGACAAGGAVLLSIVPGRKLDRDRAFLVLWAGLGLLLMLGVRFSATRFFLPFFAPLVLLSLRIATPTLVYLAVPLTAALSLLLAMDDNRLARAQQDLAIRVLSLTADQGPGLIAGHWGWQHHLQVEGWLPVEEDALIDADSVVVSSQASWPQEPERTCLEPVLRLAVPGPGWLPRVHSWDGAANFHAFAVSARPPLETYAPWTVSNDPYDVVTFFRTCDHEAAELAAGGSEAVISLEEAVQRAAQDGSTPP